MGSGAAEWLVSGIFEAGPVFFAERGVAPFFARGWSATPQFRGGGLADTAPVLSDSTAIEGFRVTRISRLRLPCLLAIALAVCSTASPPAGAAPPEARGEALYERGARALRQDEAARAVALFAEARQELPNDLRITRAYSRALVAAGRSEEAVEILQGLVRDGQASAEDELVLGVALFRLARYDEAKAQLESVVEREPDNARAHLFLGSALVELGDFDLAASQLDEAVRLDPALQPEVEYRRGWIALAQGQTQQARSAFEAAASAEAGTPVQRAARSQLDSMGGSGAGRRWGAFATLGVTYDSNVSLAGSDQNFVASDEGSARFFGQVGGRYDVYEGDKATLRVGASGYASVNTNGAVSDFNLATAQAWLVGAYELNSQLTLDARYTFEYVWAGYDPFRFTNSVEPSLRIAWTPQLLTRPYVSYTREDYTFGEPKGAVPGLNEALDRDGGIVIPGIEQYWYMPDFTGWGPGFVRGGFFYRGERVDGTEYDSNGYNTSLMVGLPLPWEISAIVSGSWERRNYLNPSVFVEGQPVPQVPPPKSNTRLDNIWRVVAMLRRPIVPDLVGEIGYRYTDWKSTVAFYDYQRHLVHFLVTYTY